MEEGLDWDFAVTMAGDMVVTFLIDAFTRDELLAGRLVGFGGLQQPGSSREKSLVSSIGRILYRLVDSNTGGQSVSEVVETALSCI